MTRLLVQSGLTDLGSRHLLEYPEGSALFPGGALDSPQSVEKRAEFLRGFAGNRTALQTWLAGQNAFAPLHPEQAKNLEAAGQADALFLLTGQQPALLGGPMLWFCKAHTCAAWAKSLSRRLGRPVIPIFWAAGDDSDLAECNAVEWLETRAATTSFSLEFPDAELPMPMSLRALPAGSSATLSRAIRTVWKTETAAIAESAYADGRTLTEAFLHLARHFLGSEGMLFVDGLAAAALAQPLLRRLAREAPEFQKALARGSRRSEESGFPHQVPLRPGSVPAFLLEKNSRLRLFFEADKGGARLYVPGAEGRDLAPELEARTLLHSALSRPLVTESIFPVLGHVLGPSELRYFAQLSEVFPAFGFSMPPLAPRQQAMVCPEKDWRLLEALGIKPAELPETGPARLRARLTEKAWGEHPASAAFPKAAFDAFADNLRQYQGSLPASGALDAGLRRLERAFGRYREAARQAVFSAEAAKTHAALGPVLRWLGHGTQDRHLNLLSLRNALGEAAFGQWTESLRSEAARLSISLF